MICRTTISTLPNRAIQRASLLILSILVVCHVAQAQHWKTIIYPVPYSPSAVCPYFINADTGFIFDHTTSSTTSHLTYFYRTTNAGLDWYPMIPFDLGASSIRQIYFTSRSHGFVVTDSAYGMGFTMKCGLVFETTDCGNTGRRFSPGWMNAHS